MTIIEYKLHAEGRRKTTPDFISDNNGGVFMSVDGTKYLGMVADDAVPDDSNEDFIRTYTLAEAKARQVAIQADPDGVKYTYHGYINGTPTPAGMEYAREDGIRAGVPDLTSSEVEEYVQEWYDARS